MKILCKYWQSEEKRGCYPLSNQFLTFRFSAISCMRKRNHTGSLLDKVPPRQMLS